MTYSLEVIGTFKRFEASPVAALANNGEAKKRSDSPSMDFGGGGGGGKCRRERRGCWKNGDIVFDA